MCLQIDMKHLLTFEAKDNGNHQISNIIIGDYIS